MLREQRAQSKLGLEFGADSIRIAVTSNDNQHRLQRFLEVPFASSYTESSLLEDPRAVAQSLRKLVHSAKLTGFPTIFSVPNERAIFSWANLPNLTGSDLRDTAKYRVNKSGAKTDELLVAVSPSCEAGGDSLIVGVPRDVAEERVDILEKAGLRPAGAEAEAQALLRTVERCYSRRFGLLAGASITIVQIGHFRTHFIVVQGGKLNFVRTVKMGYGKFELAVQSALSVDPATARNLLYSKDSWIMDRHFLNVIHEGNPARVDLGEPLDAIVKEFRRLINYFRNLHSDRSYAGVFDRLVLVGRMGKIRGFCDGIEDLLNVRAESLNPLLGVPLDTNATELLTIKSEASKFSLALGLAQAPYLLPDQQEVQNDNEYRWRRTAS